jgi:HK97 family phage prohead protease
MNRAWAWTRRVLLGMPTSPARTFDSAPMPIDRMFAELRGRGSSIGREEALRIPGVLRGRNLLCSVSTLPLVQRGPGNRVERSPLLEQVDPNVANVVVLALTFEDLMFDAVAWWRVTARGHDRFPTSAERVEPWRVSLDPPDPPGSQQQTLPSGIEPGAPRVYVDGKPVAAADMIRFDSPNPALKTVGARTFRLLSKYIDAAGMYADNPQPSEHFKPATNAEEMTDDEIAEHLSAWRSARRNGSTAYVPKQLEYVPGDSPTAADMKLPELKQQATLEAALVLGVDPEVLGVSTTSRTYANAQDWRRDRINDTFAPYMLAVTQRLSMGDVTRRGYTVAFDLDDYLRADPTTRWSVYEAGLRTGAIDVAYIQREEGLEVVGGTPAPAPTTGQPSATPAAPDVAGDELAARRQVRAGFAGEARTFEFSGARVGFNVDPSTRTIAGVALPWSEIASKYGFRYRFERGSIQWSDDVGRVKMLRDHDFTQPVGRATAITNADAGLQVAFRIGSGPDRDAVLADASDGIVDGLSVGVDFDDAADTVPDPDNEGVLLVRRATLREVSLTALPAFDGARVTTVQASRTGGDPVTIPTPAAPATPTPAAPAPTETTTLNLSADQRAALLALLGAGPAAPAAPAPAPAGPATVLPFGPSSPNAVVTEPEPYRFDRRGNLLRGSHDFSQDLVAGAAGDRAALDRATAWVARQFTIETGDVNELNPTRNRTDMFVDQRQYQYRVWETINKGALQDITPFTFPKWNSSSGLVAAHTEGQEPTSGNYTSTSQTVTPAAISGKAEITRETWDQGGNPQVSNLIWQKMVQGWYEALEARAITLLDGVSPTGITLTAGGGTTGQTATAELEAALAALHFIRGGFRMRDGFAQIDLYKMITAAKDDAGRPLYPVLGPTNANGQTENDFGAVLLGGVRWLPSWALAATGSVAASSYLFDRNDVHGWASSPQRLTFEYRVAFIDIGLWGYAATAISDLSGVREVIYDPAP